MSKISIVIPTFNSERFIVSCLESIVRQDYPNFEVIVVDNASGERTVELVKKYYPPALLIQNEDNLGACKARNQGIRKASGEWILTLDCDCLLKENFLSQTDKLIKNLSSRIGIIQPKILLPKGKIIYSTGISLTFLRKFYDLGKGQPNNIRFANAKYIFGACCAASLLKKEMLEEIKEDSGYFDERFFFLVEDVDLSWRVQRKNWKVLFAPDLICYHFGNSCGYNKKIRQYLSFRNRYYMIIKNEGFWGYAKKFFPLLFYDFPRCLYIIFTNEYIFKKFPSLN